MRGEVWKELAGLVAQEREDSLVSGDARRTISRIADQETAANKSISEEVLASRIIDELPRDDLAAIVGDWLRAQLGI